MFIPPAGVSLLVQMDIRNDTNNGNEDLDNIDYWGKIFQKYDFKKKIIIIFILLLNSDLID